MDACRVMVVDDDAAVREALEMVLVDEGCEVLCAHNGEDALAKLRSGRPLPCLILLDLMMPVMDGTAFRAEQSRDARLSGISVTVMTAGDPPEGMADVQILRKPLKLASIVSLVRGCSDHRRRGHG